MEGCRGLGTASYCGANSPEALASWEQWCVCILLPAPTFLTSFYKMPAYRAEWTALILGHISQKGSQVSGHEATRECSS